MLVEMNQKRVEALMKEKSTAAVAEKLKKALARKEQLQSLKDEDVSSSLSYPPPLRHEAKITALRKKLLPLQVLEGKAKGGFLSLAETRALTEKEEIESEIEQLEEASYGWFEEEDAFEARLQRSRDKFNNKFGKKSGGGKASSSSAKKTTGKTGAGNVNKWVLPGQKKQGGSAWGTSGGKKNTSKNKGGSVFSAMMMDSDSSSDED
jgi:plasmid maintenance system killer protein